MVKATTRNGIGKRVRNIGLHLRVTSTFTQMIEKAVRLEMPLFQCFLILQDTAKLLPLTDEDVDAYLAIRRTHFKDLYVHGSYRINLAGINDADHFALRRELAMAKRLEFTHMVMHPGAATGVKDKREGIHVMAHLLNRLVRYEHDIKFVLENAAHGNMVVGADLEDFKLLRSLLDHPEKVVYCIDTAHAHSYGYSLQDSIARDAFIQIVDDTVGIENVVLLHVNDTNELLGSKKDRHEIVGKGVIGDEVLKAWALHPRLQHIPMIMELPELGEEEEKMILTKVRNWHVL
jgi:deoxyribonuclease-4